MKNPTIVIDRRQGTSVQYDVFRNTHWVYFNDGLAKVEVNSRWLGDLAMHDEDLANKIYKAVEDLRCANN